jgi:hypothetical protein
MQQYPKSAMRQALKVLEIIKVSAPEAKALSGRVTGGGVAGVGGEPGICSGPAPDGLARIIPAGFFRKNGHPRSWGCKIWNNLRKCQATVAAAARA